MSGAIGMDGVLRQRWRAVRRRVFVDALAVALPIVCAVAVVGWRVGGIRFALLAGATASALALLAAVSRMRRFDARWLQRRLDAQEPAMEDSAGLLFADPAALGPLQRLQRARLRERVGAAPDLRPAWSRRATGLAWGTAALCVVGVWLWPGGGTMRQGDVPPVAEARGDGVPHRVAQRLAISPPAYTGLPEREIDALDARAQQGSRLRWALRFEPQPASVALEFHDGSRIEMRRERDEWIADHLLERSALYRVLPAGAPTQPLPPLNRLDAIPDRPPQVRVLEPETGLSMMKPGQRGWSVVFEASDDHGIDADARLHVTVARGSGEQITFEESTRSLRGSGERSRKRYQASIDLAGLALAWGEDLVVQLEVRDNRRPGPQSARSASLILRRPPQPVPDVGGLEGLARQVLPAYFRSQRQIIIDAEALLKEKPSLSAERFLDRSDALGVDQRLLRLRYGRFLGEESEGAGHPPPTHDAEDAPPSAPLLPIDDFGQAPRAAAEDRDADGHADSRDDDRDHDEAGHDHDGHGHGGRTGDAVFGSAGDVLAEFGHTHDLPEAATLLDPKTREILRSALREMWQSELGLRQGQPKQALPYAYRALELIKQVQQADRIYLARVGSELPPIDEGRRLSGDRAGIARRALPAAGARVPDDVPAQVWRVLADVPRDDADATDPGARTSGQPDLDALEAWLARHGGRLDDPLALVAAIDVLRNDPQCGDCRDDLRRLLWSAMSRPPAAVSRRDGIDGEGERYLDALGEPSR
ncbi:DUF4175 domain-containing protein [Marilutibacter chinensis]|uniref:DUF4175 domain-containing protein n=1 Tax=Marilutibacter chinensis TaxID=2912247 RepID=A0ABS9HXG2_9GAMM|nr:DUF4175 domain-containing protein [Lysobacter chinensis]MCF7221197.1 DUF4175 domain-containing protein [Lysobacter chinensis]MCF7223062.1 DUF4175 domain-containing protein [Lysobacter chinensis]